MNKTPKIIGIQDDKNSIFIIQWAKEYVKEPFEFLRAKYVGHGMFQSNTINMTLSCDQFPLIVDSKGIAHPALNAFQWLWSHIQEPSVKSKISKEELLEAQEVMTKYLEENLEFLNPDDFVDEQFSEPSESENSTQITPSTSLTKVPSVKTPKTQDIIKKKQKEPIEDNDYQAIAESDDSEDLKPKKEDKIKTQNPRGPLKDRRKKGKPSESILKQNQEELDDWVKHQQNIKALESPKSKNKKQNKNKPSPVLKPKFERKKKPQPKDDDSNESSGKEQDSEEEPIIIKPKPKKKNLKIVPKKSALDWSRENPRERTEIKPQKAQ